MRILIVIKMTIKVIKVTKSKPGTQSSKVLKFQGFKVKNGDQDDNQDEEKKTWHPEFQKICGMKFEESALVPWRE